MLKLNHILVRRDHPLTRVLCCAVQGHFQIVLSRRYSPMTIRGLSPFMRIMYCSGVWSYIVGAVTTPLFIIIPLLTIWAGIFPIVISWWAALALTIYYIAQSLVLNYSKKVRSNSKACCAVFSCAVLCWAALGRAAPRCAVLCCAVLLKVPAVRQRLACCAL